jgi:hypothetical protein
MFHPLNWVLQALLALVIFAHPSEKQNLREGQSVPAPVLRLGVKDEVPVPTQFATPVMFPARCDRKENVYVRFYRYPDPFGAPWVKVSADGRIAATYSLASVTEYKSIQGSDFAIGPHGEFLVIATATPKDEKKDQRKSIVVIVTFDSDGSYRSKAELDIESTIAPAKILPLPDGNFFVTGRQIDDNTDSQTEVAAKPFNAIVDPSGKIVKNVAVPNDVKLKAPSKQSSGLSLSEIPLGDAVLGDDANIYLMRRTQNPSVYVISADGQLIKGYEVKRPSETALALDMKWGMGGKLAFLFGAPPTGGGSQDRVLTVVDAQTGETQINYETGPETGAAVACFTPNGVTFIGSTDDGHLALKHAIPR